MKPGAKPRSRSSAMRGDFPRAWRLVDAFEREFLSGDFTERTIDAGAVDQWVRRRERR